MSIKLIAVDMDGTFLDDDMKYNNDRFMKQYHELKARGIKFVVASGNQYDQLKSFFPSIKNEIAFVAENGAYVIDSGKEIFSDEMSKETIKKVIDVIEKYEYTNLIVCEQLKVYHAGFLVSTIVLAITFIPHIKKLNKQMVTSEVETLEEQSKLADLFHTEKLHRAEDAPVIQPN
ncbi:HAD hydrolase family protein [Bacillus sp. PK6-026]